MAEYIEREALIEDIDAAMNCQGLDLVVGQTMKRYIKRRPAADVASVVRGRWEPFEEYAKKIKAENRKHDNEGWVYCSECEQPARSFADWAYCPNCGARMDLEAAP